jgi:hypothetical protein
MAKEGRGENPAQIGEAALHHSLFRAVSLLKSKKGSMKNEQGQVGDN